MSVKGSGPDPAEVLDRLAEVVFLTDAFGNWTYLNSAWTAITGFDVEASLGTNFLDYVHPDEREHTEALFMAVIAGGADHCHHQTRYRTRSGDYRWVHLRAQLLFDDGGRLIGNSGTLTDITGRRHAEAQVGEHTHLLELATSGAAVDDLPVGIVIYSPDLTVRRASSVVTRLLGPAATAGAAIQQLFDSLGDGSALAGEWGLVATARLTGRPQYGDVQMLPGPDGRRLAFQVSVLPLPERGPEGPAVALITHDVTGLRRAQQHQAAVAALGQRGLAGIAVADLLDEAVAVVAATLETTHCEVLELLPGADGFLARAAVGWPQGARSIGLVAADAGGSLMAQTVASAAPLVAGDLRTGPVSIANCWLLEAGLVSNLSVSIDGDRRRSFGVLAVQTTVQRSFGGDEVDFLQSVANVLASAIGRSRADEEIRQQALHDPLTGLANRVLLNDRLVQALRVRQRGNTSVGLLLMDLDRFKEINDALGHDVGDGVLDTVGRRLIDGTRVEDTVARLGGDEFAVVIPRVSSADDAVRLAEKLRTRVSELIEHNDVPLRVEASVGVVLAPEHGEDPIALLKRADVAMYRAKNLSAGVAVYSRESDQNQPERLAYFAALREAIVGGQLVVHYQPKVDLASGRTTAVEALVRWQHPSQGLVLPDLFIPLAEETGLIKQLTWWVLSEAMAQGRRWLDRGQPLPVAVNISARMLHDVDLVAFVVAELARRGLPPEALQLELTESAVMASPASAMNAITRLRHKGVRLSLDDFGTGYSSLAYLRNLPVHELKIDRSFVNEVTDNTKDASIVRSVIELGHNLGLRVVGEGIESQAACLLLRDLGCDEGQGYYLGVPLPAGDFVQVPEIAGDGQDPVTA